MFPAPVTFLPEIKILANCPELLKFSKKKLIMLFQRKMNKVKGGHAK